MLVHDDENKAPCIEERFIIATNSSDLTVTENRRTGADYAIAAGLTANRLGHALVHLRAEWDRTDKPRKQTPEEIAKRALDLPKLKGKPDIKRARVQAMVEHATAMRQRAMQLAGRNVVMGLLQEWAKFYGVDEDLLSPALFHWLAPICPVCDGRGAMKIQDAPSLSNKLCLHCQGTGMWPSPFGAERIHKHIRSCLGRVRGDMAQKLK